MKTASAEGARVVVTDFSATAARDGQGAPIPGGSRWAFYGDQADRHRVQFPEIDADPDAKAKADELRDAAQARK